MNDRAIKYRDENAESSLTSRSSGGMHTFNVARGHAERRRVGFPCFGFSE
jgi:hypothetical protein